MREIKFSYIWKCSDSIATGIYTIEDIENGAAIAPICRDSSVMQDWELVVRRQFTGLCDKNGVDIYEGDIVSITTIDNFTRETIKISNQVVTYNEKTARFDNASHFCGVSVIGNIHQNPELIEGK